MARPRRLLSLEQIVSKNLNINVIVTHTEEFQQLCKLVEDMSKTLDFYADGGRDKGEKAKAQLKVHDQIINDLIDKDIIPLNHQPPARGDNVTRFP